ncbi:hypothetical protein AVEN_251837-1 [Araneus ventricosus]|uniref:Uncharacterized protein n=1 Tax=Araneus ventricosus TaxID=182803 RepID=A0A4Y2FXH5_ARAVE|nr:hypothetical protein AVEN_251837-1 [Araneus ventricosus]
MVANNVKPSRSRGGAILELYIDREESRDHPLILASKATYPLNSRKVENNPETPSPGPFSKAKDGDWTPRYIKEWR